MAEIRINNYEAMFLLNQAVAADLGSAVTHIREMLEKAGAQIIAMKKWDERRLAYEIDKQKRGVYILVYFSCNARNVAQIERSSNLSERIMRHLIVRAEHLTVEEMQATDGQKELETEARLRSDRAAAPAGAPKAGDEQPAAAGTAEESEEA